MFRCEISCGRRLRLHMSSHVDPTCLNPRGALVTPSHRRSRARHLAYRSTALRKLSRSRLNRRGPLRHLFPFTHSHSSVVTKKCSLVRVSRRRRPGLTDHSFHTVMFSHKVFTVIFSYRVQTMVLWEHQHITQILAGPAQESSMSVHATMKWQARYNRSSKCEHVCELRKTGVISLPELPSLCDDATSLQHAAGARPDRRRRMLSRGQRAAAVRASGSTSYAGARHDGQETGGGEKGPGRAQPDDQGHRQQGRARVGGAGVCGERRRSGRAGRDRLTRDLGRPGTVQKYSAAECWREAEDGLRQYEERRVVHGTNRSLSRGIHRGSLPSNVQ